MIGTSLAHFRITAKLGEGGMGEVYRAEDSKLGREVAIKVLPEEVANDIERLARFEREAKALASLNHPNIAAIYALESATAGTEAGRFKGSENVGTEAGRFKGSENVGTEAGGDKHGTTVNFLVMELVEGEDLKERLERGALPYATVQPLALQIAEALESAHERGIIHRDLKPANIKVTPDGQVKVLDFGLAKAFDPDASSDTVDRIGVSMSPTLTAQMTQAGVLLGTAAYMSPEQARGQQVDKQADIWAFGAVVFEMLTGRMAFPGATVTDVMAAVVAQEPEWNTLPEEAPWNVTELLRLCLTKDPRQRIHDIADARLRLTSAAPAETDALPTKESKRSLHLLPWGLVALLAILAGYFALSGGQREDLPKAVQRFAINLPPEVHIVENEIMALSPDGRQLVFVGIQEGVLQLYRRDLDSSEVVPIPGTEHGKNPFFSPDGESIGFSNDKLYEIQILTLATGTTRTIADGDWGGGSWGSDGTIIYTPRYVSGLFRVAVVGGAPQELTRPDHERGELGHFWPQHLPGGEKVIYTSFSVPFDRSTINVLDLDTGETSTLQEKGVWGRYAPTGHLIFVRDQTLMAVVMDPDTLQISGAPVPVLADIRPELGQGDIPAVFADNGTLAYVPGAVMNPLRQLVWVDRQGRETALPQLHRFKHPRISPDSSRIALTIEDTSWDLWALEIERGTLSRLTYEPNTQFGALWMPGRDQILYAQDDPTYNLYRRAADGTGSVEQVVMSSEDKEARSVSPDGKILLYSQSASETRYDLWILHLKGDSEPEPWLQAPFSQNYGAFSPDGRWVAYASDETGRNEVYVNRFPEGGRRLQVSLTGGSRPRWSRDGRELFFRNGSQVMAVEVTLGDRFTASEPLELFSGDYMASSNKWDYDVAADGRFIMIKTPDEDRPREIQVVLNWFEELERLVPTD